jgi:protein SCO1
MMKQKIFCVIVFSLFLRCVAGYAQTTSATQVGIDEKLGDYAPLDLTFNAEDGRPVALRQIIDKPTILSLVYFECPNICSPLLSGVGEVIDAMPLKPGIDYKVVTISFDETEKPPLAAAKKKSYFGALHKQIPEMSWRFLTGDAASIRKLADAVGFRFTRQGDTFNHAGLIFVLSGDGKIVRYIRGISFVPGDVEMALTEAASGQIGATRLEGAEHNRLLAFCFAYDPTSKTYAPRIVRIAGLFTLLMAALFVALLLLTRKSGGGAEQQAMEEKGTVENPS